MTRIKFCGLTQADDARAAAEAGASYLGVIFAGGPRELEPHAARAVLEAVEHSTARVGVFARADPWHIAGIAAEVGLDVVQLHGDPTPQEVAAVREAFGGTIWAVSRPRDGMLPPDVAALFTVADAVVVDPWSATALGGTGTQLPWVTLRPQIDRARSSGSAELVLAGGLRPDNVSDAILAIAPDVVDVSSGVERAPGKKDHDLLRAFADAVRQAESVR